MKRPPEDGDPFLPGPTFAAPFHLSGSPEGKPYTYGRYDNPTWRAYEQAVGELEGGEAAVFGSGMGAVTTLLHALLEPGERVVLPKDAYFTVRALAHDLLPYDVREVPTDTEAFVDAAGDAKVVWVETPSNPGLDVVDIAAVAQASDATLVVDNTLVTPLGQRPLQLGADYVMASASKAMTGHSDLILGYAAGADMDAVRTARGKLGTVAGPFEVWLAHRSLATLDVRLERACANALRLAQVIAEHVPVRYPGLPSDPAHEIAGRQMTRFGPVIGFTLPSEAAADAFLAAAAFVTEATSFGGTHTTAERRARWGSDDIPEGWIRLSAGCEDPDALAEDIAQALARALERT
ncbi:MAG TPA: cystathionine gamma-lyase [Thermoleophilaceae bacterium]|nr:cystathionine gamma-lyase [Thermoleophilaceae bacterium]